MFSKRCELAEDNAKEQETTIDTCLCDATWCSKTPKNVQAKVSELIQCVFAQVTTQTMKVTIHGHIYIYVCI